MLYLTSPHLHATRLRDGLQVAVLQRAARTLVHCQAHLHVRRARIKGQGKPDGPQQTTGSPQRLRAQGLTGKHMGYTGQGMTGQARPCATRPGTVR